MIEIKHRWTGATLRTVDAENLRNADLRGANLRNADLSGADLSGNRPVTADELERRATAAMKALIQLDCHKDQLKPGRLVKEGTRAYVESDAPPRGATHQVGPGIQTRRR